MTDRELMKQAMSVLCNNVQPRDGGRDNRRLVPKSHADIYQQTIDALRDRLAQPEPEPAAWQFDKMDWRYVEYINRLIQPRKWVWLTDDECQKIMEEAVKSCTDLDDFTGQTARLTFKNIQVKLKEKNGG